MDIDVTKELLLKISNLEKQVQHLKNKLSTRKKLNNQKKNNISGNKNDNNDISTDEEYSDGDEFNYEDINMNELENKSSDEIIKVAKSIGININSEILKTIRNKVKSKRNKKEKRIDNMEKRKSLLIFQLDNSENLFWKVIRNSFIFKKILLFLNTGPYTLKYDLIFDCKRLIDSGELELLKYKVKRGDYLTNIDLVQIFNFIRDDEEFYSKLFSNYSRILFNLTSRVNLAVKNSCIAAVQVFIKEYDYKPTVEAIKETIKIQSFKTFKCLLDYFKSNSLPLPLPDIEIWKLLFSSVDATKEDIIDESKKKKDTATATATATATTTTTSTNTNKLIRKARYSNRYKNTQKKEKKEKTTKISKITKFLNYLIQDFNLELPKLTKQKLLKLYECPFYDYYTIEDVLNSCRSILLLDFKVNYSTIIPTTFETTFKTLEELESTFSVLSKDQLKQRVYEYFIENYQINHHSQIYGNLIKLLTMHYSILGKTSLVYLMLTSKSDSITLKKCMESCRLNYYLDCMFLDGLRFGEINVLLNHPKANDPNYLRKIINHLYPYCLFQFKLEKVKKIQFIRVLAESINENKINSIDIPLLLYLITANDDLEVLELAYNQFGKPVWDVQTINTTLNKDILYFIKSKEVLEYIFKNFFKDINTPIKPTSFIENDRLDLLERYIELLPSTVTKLEFPTLNPSSSSNSNSRYRRYDYYSFFDPSQMYPIKLFDIFKRMLNNPVISRYIEIDQEHFSYFDVNQLQVSKIIDLLENFPNIKCKFNINRKKIPYFYILLSRWLNYQKDEELNKRVFLVITTFSENEDEDQVDEDEEYTLSHELEEYDYISSPFSFQDVSFYDNRLSSKEGGGYMEFINNFMKPLLTPKKSQSPQPIQQQRGIKNKFYDEEELAILLKGQARLGNLEFFKSIVDNGFKFIFKKEKVAKKDKDLIKFYIPSIKLREVFVASMVNDHLDLCLFLLDECDIKVPDNIFNNHVIKNSVVHFNLMNRFNFNFK